MSEQTCHSVSPDRTEGGFRLGYCRGLDGLRGLAILAVLVFHARLASARAGYIGVQLFFALSGFLITALLLEEWDQFQRLALGRFYLRRMLRLFPALLVMLLVFVGYYWLAGPRGAAASALREAVVALCYSSNWVCALGSQRPYFLGHTWSLSIEEQFYLLWPLLLLWLLRHVSSRDSLLNWVLLVCFAACLNRCLRFAYWPDAYRISFGTDTQADSLLWGCAAAIAWTSGQLLGTSRAKALLGWCGPVSLGTLLGLTLLTPWDYGWEACLGYPLISFLAMLAVLSVVAAPDGLMGRIISQPFLVFVGRISYGLYLWHLPVFLELQLRRWPLGVELAVEFSVTIVLVLASYYCLERPLLILKSSLRPDLT